MKTAIRSMLIVGAVGYLTACSSSQPTEPDVTAIDTGPRVERVSEVVITVIPSLDAQRAQRFHEENGDQVILTAVEDALRQAGRLTDDAAPSLEVQVTAFRLRSTSGTFWLGSMAGYDSISVDVTVRDAGSVVKTFPLRRSSLKGGMFVPGAHVRLRNLAEAIAQDIVAAL